MDHIQYNTQDRSFVMTMDPVQLQNSWTQYHPRQTKNCLHTWNQNDKEYINFCIIKKEICEFAIKKVFFSSNTELVRKTPRKFPHLQKEG